MLHVALNLILLSNLPSFEIINPQDLVDPSQSNLVQVLVTHLSENGDMLVQTFGKKEKIPDQTLGGAILSTKGELTRLKALSPLPLPDCSTGANSDDNKSWVIGSKENGVMVGRSQMKTNPNCQKGYPTMWVSGNAQIITTQYGRANSINADAKIVGDYFVTETIPQPPPMPPISSDFERGFLGSAAGIEKQLKPFGELKNSEALRITAAKMIVGNSYALLKSERIEERATMWNEQLEPTSLLPLKGCTESHAYSMNESGMVVGRSYTLGTIAAAKRLPTLWNNGSDGVPLPLLEGFTMGMAKDIDDHGTVVGSLYHPVKKWIAVIWIDQQPIELNTLLPADAPYILRDAMDITNSGAISVRAVKKNNGLALDLVLIPKIAAAPTNP